MENTPRQRAEALLKQLSLEEKIFQVTAGMYFDPEGEDRDRRDKRLGSYRNPGHFMHYKRKAPASPSEVAGRINRDVAESIAAQPHGIPPIENGEALHGAQWGMATNFPQPIGLATTFDPALVERVANVIGKECRAVGVRQVFSPVVNLVRDCRWGRTVETYGEDVKLCSDMGAAMCRGLQNNGVIATPKHFADNYAAGGRDSNYSELGERTMRETILPPFKACFDAGAMGVMAAYNAWEGVPCTANERLLTEILRDEWGFDGIVVSDYGGTQGVCGAHRLAKSEAEAAAMSLKAGLNVILPYESFDTVKQALDEGLLTEEELDRRVREILEVKFRLGLFESPFSDPQAADALVRCARHRRLALEAARESIVLLKNEGVLPLKKEKLRRIGVFGQSASLIPIGSNYAGPYGTPWQGEDAPTPLEALRAFAGEEIEIVSGDSGAIETLAPACDAVLYFTAIMEGEGSDRSDLRLPKTAVHRTRDSDAGVIVDAAEQTITEDQEDAIKRLCGANKNAAVVLMNGAPVDMSAWIGEAGAVIEAWYPGEQGAKALTEILFGLTNPSGRLPITIPKSVGQLPLFYSCKPSGRGTAYCDNDGEPLYPFGYGLSYTSFSLFDAEMICGETQAEISLTVENTGERDGAEVVQVYLGSRFCDTVRPLKELKAYRRVTLKSGETQRVTFTLPAETFYYYDRRMEYGMHDGRHTLFVGTSSDALPIRFELAVQNGRITR